MALDAAPVGAAGAATAGLVWKLRHTVTRKHTALEMTATIRDESENRTAADLRAVQAGRSAHFARSGSFRVIRASGSDPACLRRSDAMRCAPRQASRLHTESTDSRRSDRQRRRQRREKLRGCLCPFSAALLSNPVPLLPSVPLCPILLTCQRVDGHHGYGYRRDRSAAVASDRQTAVSRHR